jgi:hypothetical protein
MRTRLGYVPIKVEEVPGWEHISAKTGEYVGCIAVNELLAYKIPTNLYMMYMEEAHHNQPFQEEQKLKNVLDLIKREAEERGANVEAGEGNEELGKYRVPIFEDN